MLRHQGILHLDAPGQTARTAPTAAGTAGTALSLFAMLSALAASAAPVQAQRAALEALVSDDGLAGARVGAIVLDLDSNRVLCAHDADMGFMTASNMKLITSATALVTLGPDYRFRTTLAARTDSPLEAGVLRGDLELIGAGDPTLGGPQERGGPAAPFERMAARLRQGGITRVTGRVLGNDNCQPDEVMGEGWSWGYQTSTYAAQISGLCFAENCVTILLKGAQDGARPAVWTRPRTTFFDIECTARCAAKPRGVHIERQRATNRILVAGQFNVGNKTGARRFSVENPTDYAAHVLRDTLERAGITIDGPAADMDDVARPEGARRVLAEHRSAPLSEILTKLNKDSQNLYAEQLIRAAARHAVGKADMRSAASHATSVMKRLGVDTTGLVIADGCGLTRLNLVRPSQLAALLAGIWRSEHRSLFVSTLPVAGVDGSLKNRLRGTAAQQRVHAKTGYISRVVALSGYVSRPGRDRAPLVFSVLLNNFVCSKKAARAAVDKFVASLAELAGWSRPRR